MSTEKHHISTYTAHGTVLTILLLLTALSVAMAELHLGALSVAVALLVASVKGTTVLTYFMHLKYESLFFKIMVSAVFVMYLLIIVFLFFDYLFR
jgi:cytochrome c oxidase subunit 4